MFFIEEIKKLIINNKINKLGIFIDMDGVVADYRFGEGENIKNNIQGTFINKRPIKTNIDILKIIKENIKCELHIISSCLFEEQKNEKLEWLNKNMKFIKKDNIDIVISDNFENRKQLKVDKILEKMKMNNYDYSILIDDTHEILFLALKKSNGKIIPFHVVTLLD